MLNVRTNRIILSAALILLVILCLVLVALVRQNLKPGTAGVTQVLIYLLLFGVIGCGVLMFSAFYWLYSNMIQHEGELAQIIEDKNRIIDMALMQKKTDDISAVIKKEEFNIHETLKKIMPRDEKSRELWGEMLLLNISREMEIVQGMLFYLNAADKYCYCSSYAWFSEEKPQDFSDGDGIAGQVAKNKTILIVDEVPANYIQVFSGLGKSSPRFLVFIPLLQKDKCVGIIELASFKKFEDTHLEVFELLSSEAGHILHNFNKGKKNTEAV